MRAGDRQAHPLTMSLKFEAVIREEFVQVVDDADQFLRLVDEVARIGRRFDHASKQRASVFSLRDLDQAVSQGRHAGAVADLRGATLSDDSGTQGAVQLIAYCWDRKFAINCIHLDFSIALGTENWYRKSGAGMA